MERIVQLEDEVEITSHELDHLSEQEEMFSKQVIIQYLDLSHLSELEKGIVLQEIIMSLVDEIEIK